MRGYEKRDYHGLPMSSTPPINPQARKPPTARAIEKALEVLTTRYRVTLDPLPHPTPSEQQARKKEITL